VSRKPDVDAPESPRAWTGPDAYIGALARKRRFRHSRADKPRTQPEAPRMLLSTIPFIALLALLAVLAVAIMISAFPGAQPRSGPQQIASQEKGVAQRGWFQEAQKQFHK
jgi:hypothetical protein